MTAVLSIDIEPDTEVLVRPSEMDWVEWAPGIEFKTLRTSSETGVWTVLFKCEAGSSFPAHIHYGAGEYFVITGRMDYRMGIAQTGDYGYEPLGAYHEETRFLEDTELLFTNHGPVAFIDENRAPVLILDWKFFADNA